MHMVFKLKEFFETMGGRYGQSSRRSKGNEQQQQQQQSLGQLTASGQLLPVIGADDLYGQEYGQ